jgi:predicted membrane protein
MKAFKDRAELATYIVIMVALAAVVAVITMAVLDQGNKTAQSGAAVNAAGPAVVAPGEAVTYVLGIKLEQAFQGGPVLRLTYSLSGAIHAWDFEDGAALEHYLEYLGSFGPITYFDMSGAAYLTQLEG